MSRLARIVFVLGLGVAGVLADPSPAAAQFNGGYGIAIPGVGPGSRIGPLGAPLAVPNFYYGWSTYAQIPNPLGGGSLTYASGYYGSVGYWMQNRNRGYNSPYDLNRSPIPSYGAYTMGGVRNSAVEGAGQAFGRAQQQSTQARMMPGTKTAIYDQWAYERLGVSGLPGLLPGQEPPEALAKALAAANPEEVASGEALNHIVVGIVAAQSQGGKGDSAFLPPNLLASVRFSGGPNADALNLLRSAGKLEFPAAFDDGPLAGVRADVEKEFAAVAAPALVGKAPDPARVARLEATVKKAHDLLTPAIKDMDFAEATAARRFLNQLDTASKVLKTPSSATLLDPKWTTEGASVADLVKHMTKHKLLFGPVEKGQEDVYVALHRGLAAYLFTLGENAAKPKK
jgi:hypothetical protein